MFLKAEGSCFVSGPRPSFRPRTPYRLIILCYFSIDNSEGKIKMIFRSHISIKSLSSLLDIITLYLKVIYALLIFVMFKCMFFSITRTLLALPSPPSKTYVIETPFLLKETLIAIPISK